MFMVYMECVLKIIHFKHASISIILKNRKTKVAIKLLIFENNLPGCKRLLAKQVSMSAITVCEAQTLMLLVNRLTVFFCMLLVELII